MEQQSARLRNTGFLTFFFSGICAISAGVVVSLLQERYGFAYGMTGTLLSLMSVGNLLAGLLIGMLPSVLGMKRSVLLLTIGYAVGYSLMGLTGAVAVLALAFFLVGIAKGSVMNTCTILVSDNSANRTPGHEPDAQLLRLRCTAVPLPHCSGGKGEHRTGSVPAGGAGPDALAGVWIYSAGRRESENSPDERGHRLELSARAALLAADRPSVLPERGGAERYRLDGDLF